mgnify:CR=1 FL=1
MVVRYDEQFFEDIPEEIVKELRSLRSDPRFSNIPDVSRTMLWQYFIDRKNHIGMSFDEFKKYIKSGYGGGGMDIDIAFTIPPIESASKSDRIFVAGFGLTDERVHSFLANNDLQKSPLSQTGRLNFMWNVFYDSQGNNFLDDPTITLPKLIVHGETMKGHEGIGNAHFNIEKLMQGLGKKYSIPVHSLEGQLAIA